MVTHMEAQTFEISKLKNLLEKPWNPPEVTRICQNLKHDTIIAQNMKFSIKNFFSKCGQIRGFQQIWLHLLKKSLMENFIFYAVHHGFKRGSKLKYLNSDQLLLM